MPWKEHNLRQYQRQLERDLVIGVVVLLVVVGSVLTGLIYGWQATFTALLCLVPGAAALVVLWVVFRGLSNKLEQ